MAIAHGERRLQFLSFWAINDALVLTELKRQMDELHHYGLDGVIFHPRYYPNDPLYMGEEYLRIVSELILYAKTIGMSFWLYDENGWPSGTAGGAVMAESSALQCVWVEWKPGQDGVYGLSFRSRSAPSSLDPQAVSTFIRLTHEAYRQGLASEAFQYVEGFFSDEVAFLDGHGLTISEGAIPWDDRLPELYRERYDEELMPVVPLLFEEGEGCEAVRYRYWELLTELLANTFYRPIREWCETHGKRYTAHLKGEEHPLFQVSCSGSCFRVLKEVETPAVDALERYPGNHYYPRIVHSIAMQLGREHVLAEAMGGSGWGITPEHFTGYILWLASHGIDRFVLHLNQYRLKTEAIHDWPPSMPCHLTWREAFPSLLASIKRQAAALPNLRQEPELLIVTPTRGIMASFTPQDVLGINGHDGSGYADHGSGGVNKRFMTLIEQCHEAGLHYELTEEKEVECGQLLQGALYIGHRAYRSVLIPEGCKWQEAGMTDRLREAGISVYTTHDWREILNSRGKNQESEPEVNSRAVSAMIPEQSEWQVMTVKGNQLAIEFAVSPDGHLTAEYRLDRPTEIGSISLVLHDEVQSVKVNGRELDLFVEENRYVAPIPRSAWEASGVLRIEIQLLPKGEQMPVAFVRGEFSVYSESDYHRVDDHQVATRGPFYLAPLQAPKADDVVTTGYPFAGDPIDVLKQIVVERDIGQGYLQLTDIQAAAARVYIDRIDTGWCWGPQWNIACPEGLRAGSHVIRVQLYPSTYNMYGPHLHIDGDRYLTSPEQYAGIKNFADRVDAPSQTLGERWHFVNWGISGQIMLSEH